MVLDSKGQPMINEFLQCFSFVKLANVKNMGFKIICNEKCLEFC